MTSAEPSGPRPASGTVDGSTRWTAEWRRRRNPTRGAEALDRLRASSGRRGSRRPLSHLGFALRQTPSRSRSSPSPRRYQRPRSSVLAHQPAPARRACAPRGTRHGGTRCSLSRVHSSTRDLGPPSHERSTRQAPLEWPPSSFVAVTLEIDGSTAAVNHRSSWMLSIASSSTASFTCPSSLNRLGSLRPGSEGA